MFDKVKIKNYVYSMVAFLIGVLSVAIANVFFGFYWPSTIITTTMAMALTYNYFDSNSEKISRKKFLTLVLVLLIAAFEILFFIVNDIIGKIVYNPDHLGFFGVCVRISQFISVIAMVYSTVCFILELNKSKIEVIDNNSSPKDDKNETNKANEIKEEDSNISNETEGKVESIARLIDSQPKNKAPFMEEEK